LRNWSFTYAKYMMGLLLILCKVLLLFLYGLATAL
jgi:hypothetical protein